MARFDAKGIEGLALSMQEFAAIPDDVVEKMLTAAGEVVVAAQKRALAAQGLVKTGRLAGSIQSVSKAGSARNDWKRYVLVYPGGNHHTYQSRVITKAYARSRHGRTYTTGGGAKVATNSDVGFIYEYGAPGRNINARKWMQNANEGAGAAVEAAEFAVYDGWLKSLNL